jgi:hypothetical protein
VVLDVVTVVAALVVPGAVVGPVVGPVVGAVVEGFVVLGAVLTALPGFVCSPDSCEPFFESSFLSSFLSSSSSSSSRVVTGTDEGRPATVETADDGALDTELETTDDVGLSSDPLLAEAGEARPVKPAPTIRMEPARTGRNRCERVNFMLYSWNVFGKVRTKVCGNVSG